VEYLVALGIWIAVTVAPITGFPDASVTMPTISEVVSCAKETVLKRNSSTKAAKIFWDECYQNINIFFKKRKYVCRG